MKMNQIVMSLFIIKHEDYSDMDIDEEEKYPYIKTFREW